MVDSAISRCPAHSADNVRVINSIGVHVVRLAADERLTGSAVGSEESPAPLHLDIISRRDPQTQPLRQMFLGLCLSTSRGASGTRRRT